MVSRFCYASLFVLLTVIICFSFGCAPTHPRQFSNNLLTSAPKISQAELADPPKIHSDLYLKESPGLLTPAFSVPPRPGSVADRIRRADSRFASGKLLHQQGDADGARKEFNRAIDILLATPESASDRPRLERKLEELADAIYRYDVDKLGSGETAPAIIFDKSPLDDIVEMTFPIDPKLKPKVKEELQATVSQLPLEENDSVLSLIHFFSSDKGRRTLVAGLRRAGRYRALIERILDEEGVPQELIYLAQAESAFLPRAVSNKQATGMWQFIQDRGRQYGLLQTAFGDDRLDPEKATRAAARHLRDLYNHFGDWYLAMAAYDCGPGNVDRAIQRTGYADYWELRSRQVLPRETQNYIPAILAITIMAKNPKDYGLQDIEPDRPIEYDIVTLQSMTHLALIADAAERPLADIRDLNPSLLKNVAPAGCQLRVPKGRANSITAALENIPDSRRASWRVHHVERGETLAVIAKRYHTPAASIASINNMASPLEAGDVLIIPSAYEQPIRVASRVGHVARRANVSPRSLAKGRTSSRRMYASRRRVPERILHRRATASTIKTASLR